VGKTKNQQTALTRAGNLFLELERYYLKERDRNRTNLDTKTIHAFFCFVRDGREHSDGVIVISFLLFLAWLARSLPPKKHGIRESTRKDKGKEGVLERKWSWKWTFSQL
jgi:hypothetical protein